MIKLKDMEVSRLWTLSLTHVSNADNQLIHSHIKNNFTDIPLAVLSTESGYYVGMIEDKHDMTPFGTQLMEAGFSSDFAEIFCIAIRHNIKLINFDYYGHAVEGLPEFDIYE